MITGSHYAVSCIVLAVRCVIDATVPMRAASRISGLINELNGDGPYDYPSHTTVQNFILRIGLYLLRKRPGKPFLPGSVVLGPVNSGLWAFSGEVSYERTGAGLA